MLRYMRRQTYRQINRQTVIIVGLWSCDNRFAEATISRTDSLLLRSCNRPITAIGWQSRVVIFVSNHESRILLLIRRRGLYSDVRIACRLIILTLSKTKLLGYGMCGEFALSLGGRKKISRTKFISHKISLYKTWIPLPSTFYYYDNESHNHFVRET